MARYRDEAMRAGGNTAAAAEDRAPRQSIYDSDAWRRVVCETYGFTDRSIRLGDARLPLFLTTSPLLGRKLSSAVFNTYASPRFADVDECAALLDAAVSIAERERVDVIEIKSAEALPPRATQPAGFAERGVYQRTLIPLDGAAEFEARLRGKFRRQLRALRRDWDAVGLQLERSQDMIDLELFHDLLVRCNRDTHMMVAQPYAFFVRLWKELRAVGALDLWVVRDRRGEIVAGCVFGLEGEVATGMFSASAEHHRRHAVDTLMKADAIRSYADRGFRWADLGICSPRQEGLVFAKSRFAGETETLPYYFRPMSRRHVPDLDYADAYMWLRRPYRFVPVPLAKRISAGIVRFLN